MKRKCPECGMTIKGHPNKKFCCTKHKDRYHNRNNPRGYYSYLRENTVRKPDSNNNANEKSLLIINKQ